MRILLIQSFLKKSPCVSERVGILIPVACNERDEAFESN